MRSSAASPRPRGAVALVAGVAAVALLTLGSPGAPGPWPAPLAAQTTSGPLAEESRTLALAIHLERSGQPGEAERALIELLGSQPRAAQALSMLARLTAARGAPDVVLPYAEAAARSASYDEAAIHQVYIRALAASGLADDALEAARAWVRQRPSDISGFAELSNTYATLGRHDEAVETLLDARRRTGDDDLFSQELAILYESAGGYDEAAREWLRVLAWGEAGVTAVEARLRTPGVPRDVIVDAILAALDGTPAGVGALRGGLDLALRVGRTEAARRLAEQFVARAPVETRRPVLRKYYMDARDGGWAEDARWAAGRLAADAADPRDRLQWEAVEASLALELGDRAHARTAFERILAAAPEGSDTRRLAINSLVVLRADDDDQAAEQLIGRHAAEYPREEAELADLAIRLSQARVRRGDISAARRALDLAPRQPADASTASRLEAQRGHLALFQGRVSEARQHLETAGRIPGGDPGERTEILLLLDLFSRADSTDLAELGRGIYDLRAAAEPEALLASVEDWSRRSGGSEARAEAAAGLMRLAAGALEHDGFAAQAGDVRRRLVEVYPATPEATGALLALARSELPDRPEAARAWLQRLIIEHPDSALAPVARRLLSEIEGRVPSGDGGSPSERTL
ncbi:MAG TPA: tetratricopeptide repeat protein [Thermohalobaculum sp.]|nr:tetratricopeptide repeat protein [Thermohalobaculum sp.]